MSVPFWPFRAAAARAFGALACSFAFAALVGCHRGSFGAAESSSPEPPKGGYGEQLSGTIHSVTTEQLNHRSAAQLEELLDGRFPGVTVARTASGGFLVQVRGIGTFLGRPEPLYVIDGIPVQVHPQRGIDWLSPHDIQSITVLKGPPDTSLYGARSANGVIVISTKRR
jgi:TonB-dependent SusC/RagA subfamily outer membrane receptor